MQWPSNVHSAGIAHHLIRRGYARGACFLQERDRTAFLRWLGRYATRFKCSLHAYVLMNNHVHLLVTPGCTTGLSALMGAICTRHERHMRDTGGTVGPLWEERYESSPIHVGRHLLACMRYIELNPVRAGLVTQPAAYPWSSYRANALGKDDALVTPHAFYYTLGRTALARRTAYLRSFERFVRRGDRTSAGRRTGPRARFQPT